MRHLAWDLKSGTDVTKTGVLKAPQKVLISSEKHFITSCNSLILLIKLIGVNCSTFVFLGLAGSNVRKYKFTSN